MAAWSPFAVFVSALALIAFSQPSRAQRGASGPRGTLAPQPATSTGLAPGLVPRAQAKAAGTRPAIVLTGYWPPSNEALRRFSTNAAQNPQGWIGQDWEGRGYDVHAFFPEFTPPNCSSCGKGSGDLEVDYQDTTADFWSLVPALNPIAVITFSRGFDNLSWELEMNQFNRTNWIGDFVAPFMPTPNPPDGGFPTNGLRPSTLPVQLLMDKINAAQLGALAYICFSGNGGGYLSEFSAYNGVWYQALHSDPSDPSWCAAAGHVHVGGQLTWSVAKAAAEETLRGMTAYLDTVLYAPCAQPQNYCNAKTTSGGCLPTVEAIGYPSLSSGSFQVRATGMQDNLPGLVIWSLSPAALHFQGGTLCVAPPIERTPAVTVTAGFANPPCSVHLAFTFSTPYVQSEGFSVGQTVYAQAWSRDTGDPFGSSLTDALSFVWCP